MPRCKCKHRPKSCILKSGRSPPPKLQAYIRNHVFQSSFFSPLDRSIVALVQHRDFEHVSRVARFGNCCILLGKIKFARRFIVFQTSLANYSIINNIRRKCRRTGSSTLPAAVSDQVQVDLRLRRRVLSFSGACRRFDCRHDRPLLVGQCRLLRRHSARVPVRLRSVFHRPVSWPTLI